MRKILSILLICGLACTANAVPAYPGWITYPQADGSTIELQQLGDEFAHVLINRDGEQVRLNEAGMYEVVGATPSMMQLRARRAASQRVQARKVRKEFGVTPNLAPRGVVIMVNYQDQTFETEHTRDIIDSLCNAVDCKVNSHRGTYYPSAAQYFADQSDGAYRPIFDVYGPYTLSRKTSYYGENDDTKDANDKRAVNMLIEACKLADEAGVDFTPYDSDEDGKIDFVYVLYAGKGEANGGGASTVWPHSWSVDEQLEFEEYYAEHPEEFVEEYKAEFVPYLTQEYTLDDCFVDGKQINTYACSNELSGSSLDGIGTLCHEFGHVMGLPDFYDIYYGTNSTEGLTPGKWDVMDQGSYNKSGHCPPNYSAWEKYFFGWHTPVSVGSEGQDLTMVANGQTGYQAYQLYSGDDLIAVNDSLPNDEVCYYLENRQQQGWDAGVPGHGMIIWQIRYSKTAWKNNEPNTEDYQPRYTLLPAHEDAYVGTSADPYPGDDRVKSVTIAGKPITAITEKNGTVTFQINGGTPQGLESEELRGKSGKFIREGQLIIQRGEGEYTILGTKIR